MLWCVSVFAHIGGLLVVEPEVAVYLPTILIYILAVLLMVTYDHGPATKNKGLLGNIIISILVGAVIPATSDALVLSYTGSNCNDL